MKIEMDQNAANTAQVGIICLAVAMVAYFIIVVWWDGLNDNKRDIALAKEANTAAKIAACSVEYGWTDYHKEQYVKYEFCGDEND